MECPDCGGPMWDNRQSKRNPKQPDYKCKDKGCGKAVWEQKQQGGGNNRGATQGAALKRAPTTWRSLHLAFQNCHKIAREVYGKDAPADVLHAGTATLLIAAKDLGMTAVKPKPKPEPPPPPPPPPEEPSDDFPEDDDLPFD